MKKPQSSAAKEKTESAFSSASLTAGALTAAATAAFAPNPFRRRIPAVVSVFTAIAAFFCFFLLHTSAPAQARHLGENLFHPLPEPQVKDWKTLRDDGIVKQSLDYSCGAASIATLLNLTYGQSLREEDILQLLLPHSGESGRASFADMQKILPSLGFRGEGYALSFEQLLRLRAPVIVYLRYRSNDHFSVLYGIDEETVLLADPALGHLSLSRAQFLQAWQTRDSALHGKVLAIVPANAHSFPSLRFFTRHPQRQSTHTYRLERMRHRF